MLIRWITADVGDFIENKCYEDICSISDIMVKCLLILTGDLNPFDLLNVYSERTMFIYPRGSIVASVLTTR